MNKQKLFLITLSISAILLSGCSINHPVAEDYQKHLSVYSGKENLPKTSLESKYTIDKKTENHKYEFRAATVGYAHVWIVEFGKILDESISAPYIQSSFGKLTKSSNDSLDENNITFSLMNYEFKNHRAYVNMNITLKDKDKEIINKNYKSEGISQGGKMFLAGPFGMKTATLSSTKSAIDNIFTQFINDIESK